MCHRFLATALLVALAAVALVIAPAQPAAALVVPGSAYVTINDIGGLEACGDGESDSLVNTWVLTVEGARSDGSRIFVQVTGKDRGFHECVPIAMGTAGGLGTATLSFLGVGTDVAATFGGYFAWTSATGPFGAGSGVRPT